MKTLIIDNYDSFTYNLYQYIGELGGDPEVFRNDEITIPEIKCKYNHIVISPGPGSPDDQNYFGICREVILQLGKSVSILGVCLGHQGIISAYGGNIVRANIIKHGKQSLIEHNGKGIFKGVKNPLSGMRYHSLVGEKGSFPEDLEITAVSSDDRAVMGVQHKKYPISGMQFHPESILTKPGKDILANFLWCRKA